MKRAGMPLSFSNTKGIPLLQSVLRLAWLQVIASCMFRHFYCCVFVFTGQDPPGVVMDSLLCVLLENGFEKKRWYPHKHKWRTRGLG